MKYGLRVKAVYPLKTRHRYKGGFKIRIVFFVFPKAFFGFDLYFPGLVRAWTQFSRSCAFTTLIYVMSLNVFCLKDDHMCLGHLCWHHQPVLLVVSWCATISGDVNHIVVLAGEVRYEGKWINLFQLFTTMTHDHLTTLQKHAKAQANSSHRSLITWEALEWTQRVWCSELVRVSRNLCLPN